MNIDETVVRKFKLFIEKFYSKNHNFIRKSNSRNTNWIVNHFTQVNAAEDIKCQRQNPSQVI